MLCRRDKRLTVVRGRCGLKVEQLLALCPDKLQEVRNLVTLLLRNVSGREHAINNCTEHNIKKSPDGRTVDRLRQHIGPHARNQCELVKGTFEGTLGSSELRICAKSSVRASLQHAAREWVSVTAGRRSCGHACVGSWLCTDSSRAPDRKLQHKHDYW
jgi:hypothetical protein